MSEYAYFVTVQRSDQSDATHGFLVRYDQPELATPEERARFFAQMSEQQKQILTAPKERE